MKIALTQMDIVWENPIENKKICQRLTREAGKQHCDWIIFPEMTLTGFTMNPEQFREPIHTDAPTRSFFQRLSLDYNIGIAYGYIACKQEQNYNHFVYVQNGITIFEYAKLHPFSYGEESYHYHAGSQIMTTRIGDPSITLSGFICYDLRFPEIFQKASRDATVIFVTANWPEPRIAHWYSLLQARAIENQCFIIGVNRTGDGGGLHYIPSSVAFNPYGERITPEADSELLYADIQPELAEQYRNAFPLKKDRRADLYETSLQPSLYDISQ